MNKIIIAIGLTVSFTGCAAIETKMVNDVGEVLYCYQRCDASCTWSFDGDSLAANAYNQCLNEAGLRGFHPSH